MHDSATGPLTGLLVLDFGQAAVGPVAASYLSMLGATVLKIESPSGDTVRRGEPTMRGMGTTFIGNNIGKFGLELDLKSERDRAVALELISVADVMIDNFRSVSVMSRLGLDYFELLSKRNPRLIYLQASAFGLTGPWNGMVSFEWIAQASSGFTGSTGTDGGLPEFSRGTAYLDWNGAMMNVIAMLAGIRYRDRTGSGLMLESSQFGSAVYTSVARILEDVSATPRHGSAGIGVVPDRAFRTSDAYLTVTAPTDACWQRLCKTVARPDLAASPDLATQAGRFERRAAVERELAAEFAHRPSAEWLGELRGQRVPCSVPDPALTITQRMSAEEQVTANHMLTRQLSPYGNVLTQTPHWRFGRARASLRRPSPQLGEHTELATALLDHIEPRVTPDPPTAATDWSSARVTPIAQDTVLGGLRVVEIGSGMSPAVAGMVLRQLGAHVIKLERPGGDWLRHWGGATDTARLWTVLNEGKAVTTCDLREDRERFVELVRDADVVVASGPLPARTALGCDYPTLRELNPGVLYAGISGWGPEGPLADQPATELDVQIAAGMTLQLGRRGAEPVRQGFSLASVNTGYAAVQAIMAMLHAKTVSGETEGDSAEVSLLHTAIALSQWNTTAESDPDEPVGRQLDAFDWDPDHGYECADGRVLIALRGNENAWTDLFLALDRADVLADERFATVEQVRKHERLLPDILGPQFRERTTAQITELVRERLGGTVVPILEPAEVLTHQQTVSLGFIGPADGGLSLTLPVRHVTRADRPDGDEPA